MKLYFGKNVLIVLILIVRFCSKFREKIIVFLPVSINKSNFVAILVFFGTTAPLDAKKWSSRTFVKQDAILTPVPKQ